MADEQVTGTESTPPPASPRPIEKVTVRPYPKVIFFWPTWVLSLVAGIVMSVSGEPPPVHLGTVWMCVFAFNLMVISFDFSEVISLEGVAGTACVFDGRVWHGTGPNTSSTDTRRFCRPAN